MRHQKGRGKGCYLCYSLLYPHFFVEVGRSRETPNQWRNKTERSHFPTQYYRPFNKGKIFNSHMYYLPCVDALFQKVRNF
jgi:hypothetical protein